MSAISFSEQEFLTRVTEIIETNLHNEQFGVSELARKMGMSRTSLHRKIKSTANTSISQFICQVRLKKALELLKQNSSSISETAYECGFHSVSYFNKCFRDFYGYPPGETGKHLEAEINKDNDQLHTSEKKKKWQQYTPVLVLLLVVVLVISAILYFKTNNNAKNNMEKSIAVLPFVNDSSDSTNIYFINGVMEAIINNLSAIKDLRVVSRSSTEQYRNNTNKSITQKASELGVNYIVEGSGQKTGDKIKLHVQLIEAKSDKHLFSQPYERDLEEIFSLQSEIASSVAAKINAAITPEEMNQIEKKPTKNIAALNQFLKGDELRKIADLENNKNLALQAEVFLQKAIQLDSTYVAPYISLGWSYNLWHGDLDSGMYFANRALLFDNRNPGALGLKGWILMMKGLYKESEEILQQAINYNPNHYVGYELMAATGYFTGNYAKSIEYYLKALKLNTDKFQTGNTLKSLCGYLYLYGLYEEGLKFAEIQIEKNNDSLLYYMGSTKLDVKNKNYSSALQNSVKAMDWKSTNFWAHPFYISLLTKDYKTAATYIDKFTDDQLNNCIGFELSYNYWYALLKKGEVEKANHYSEEAIKFWLKKAEEQNPYATCNAYFTLMHINSAMGNKARAMENVRMVLACKDFEIEPYRMYELKNHPIFEAIRDEPDFQKLIQKNEARIQYEMKKIEKILRNYWEENSSP